MKLYQKFLTLVGVLAILAMFGGIVWVQNRNSTLANAPMPTSISVVDNQTVSTTTPETLATEVVPQSVDSGSETVISESVSSVATNPVINGTATNQAVVNPVTTLVPQTNVVVVPPPTQPVPNVTVLSVSDDSSARQAFIQQVQELGGQVEVIDALNNVVVTMPEGVAIPQSSVVLESEPDYYVSVQVIATDPLISQQWALSAMNIPMNLPDDLPLINVAVIDSGICQHAELNNKVIGGYDFVQNDATPQDEMGHGCAVASIIAAEWDGQGMAGIAPNARLLVYRVLNAQGSGRYSHVANAIVRAVDDGAQIINLSLGGVNSSQLLQDAINYATSRDVLVVAAAGNNGSSSVLYPAAYPNVISVGALNQDNTPASFSNTGKIDVWAPGVNVLALNSLGEFNTVNGTSFAAPNVTGLAAIELAEGRELTTEGVVNYQENPDLNNQPIITSVPTVNVDFESIAKVPEELHTAVISLLQQDPTLTTQTTQFVSTAYRSSIDNTWARIVLFPAPNDSPLIIGDETLVISFSTMIEVLLKKTNGQWEARSYTSSDFDTFRQDVPSTFIDFSSEVSGLTTNVYRFPWTNGQNWYRTQGWHSAYYGIPGGAIDFQPEWPRTGNLLAVLSASIGTLDVICQPDSGGQAWLKTTNSDGIVGYGHLDANTVRGDLYGQVVQMGQYIGSLYNPNPNQNFSSPCGFGASPHLHLILQQGTIQFFDVNLGTNITADTLGIWTGNTLHQSNNIRIDNYLPEPALLTPTNNTFVSTRRPTFTWNGVSGATGYELRYGTTNPPTGTPIAVSGTSYTATTDLPLGKIYWQMRTINGSGAGDWSWIPVFTISVPAPINTNLITNGDMQAASLTPWQNYGNMSSSQLTDGTNKFASFYRNQTAGPDASFNQEVYYTHTALSRVLLTVNLGNSTSTPKLVEVRFRELGGANLGNIICQFNLPANLPLSPYIIRGRTPNTPMNQGLVEFINRDQADGNGGILVDNVNLQVNPALVINSPTGLDCVPPTLPIPTAPTIQAPTAAFVNTSTPTVSWNTVANATSYIVEFSTNNFATITQSQTVTTTSFTPTALVDGVYSIRVRGLNIFSQAGPNSIAKVVTIDTIAPSVPVLSVPANNATVTTFAPAFTWVASTGTPMSYEFRYGVNTAPNTTLSNIVATTFTSPNQMGIGVVNWQVRARDAAGNWSAWSTPSVVNINSVPGSAPRVVQQSTNVVLTWNPQTWSQGYEIQVSTNSTFTSIVYQTNTIPAGTASLNVTLNNGTFFWRIRGKTNTTTWSVNWSTPETLIVR
jgi:thermitase